MIPSGPSGEHLFTVAVGPVELDGYGPDLQVILVSFTSVKPGAPVDDACLVYEGEHPFITRASYIYYREPRLYSVATVQRNVNADVWRQAQPCDQDLMQRVLYGFRRSKRLPRYFNKILDELGY